MRIDEFIDAALRRSILKKVRVRVDPRESNFNLHLSSSYEGYVLEEHDTTVTVYFVNTPAGIEPVQNVQKQHISNVQDTDATLIDKICKVVTTMGIRPNNPVLQQIRNANNAEFLDSYLKQLGFDDKELLQIYKKACMLTEANDTPTKAIVDAGIELADRLTGWLADLPKLAVGQNSIFRRLARFLKTADINELIKINQTRSVLSDQRIRDGEGNTSLKHPVAGQLLYISSGMSDGLKVGKTTFESVMDDNQNRYNLVGRFTQPVASEKEFKHGFAIVAPENRSKLFGPCYADFGLFSKTHTGKISLTLKKTRKNKAITECYTAKFVDFKNVKYALIQSPVSCELPSETKIELTKELAGSKALGDVVSEKNLSPDRLGKYKSVIHQIQRDPATTTKVNDLLAKFIESEEYKTDKFNHNKLFDLMLKQLESVGIKAELYK